MIFRFPFCGRENIQGSSHCTVSVKTLPLHDQQHSLYLAIHTTMEEEQTPRLPPRIQQGVDCSTGNYERTMDVPAAVTMSNSNSLSMNGLYYSSGYTGGAGDYEDCSSAYGSSFDASSASSSVLTSSLSSFEFSGAPADILPGRERTNESDDESSNADQLAKMMVPLMLNRGGEISHALAERVSCIDSIKWLGHHLPESVVAFLIDEIEVEEAGRGPMSDCELQDFNTESENHLDYEDSQILEENGCGGFLDQDGDEKSLSQYELGGYLEHGPQQSFEVREENDESHNGSSVHKSDDPENRNDSAVYRNNENSKHAPKNNPPNSVSRNDYGTEATSDSALYHDHHVQNYYHDSYTAAESAGYHADYHDSNHQFGSDNYASYQDSNNFNNDDYTAPYNDSGLSYANDDHDSDNDKLNDSVKGPLHYLDSHDAVRRRPQLLRRHSVIGMKTTKETSDAESLSFMKEILGESKPQHRVARRLSMPLVLRSKDTTNNSGRQGSRSSRLSVCDSSSGGSGSSLRFHKQTNDRKETMRMRQRGSAVSVSSISSLLFKPRGSVASRSGENGVGKDPFPYSSEGDEKRDLLRQDRVLKTRASMRKLSGGSNLLDLQQHSNALDDDEQEGDIENMYFTDAIPPATRHDCALLFVDISGFTKLSTTLPVEPLSKVSTSCMPVTMIL